MFISRPWQEKCLAAFRQKVKEEGEGTAFVFEACMGAGKSSEAAMQAQILINEYGVNHVLVLVPFVSIQGDVDKGMLGAFGQLGLDARDHFFTAARRQVRQPIPRMDATVTMYQEVCCQQAVETLKMWKASHPGFKFALMCDEIHHTNEINSSWGAYVEQLKALASYSVFMSGTYFRSDKKPISCVPLDAAGEPIKDYRYPYREGVRDNVVRAVTTRDINARVRLYDRVSDAEYETDLSQISLKELSAAKKQVLDPNGECIRHIIETVHSALIKSRSKFPDAACLFVCRPGGSDDNYTLEGEESQEDRHIAIIAKRIEQLTGHTPTVVTHHDRDSAAKIARFRRGTDPYLVAINMVSEGCDIPRLRAVAFCRYTNSEMLFRQIVGRALRLHQPEDGTAAQIYIPAFPALVQFAERLYAEAQEGIRDRRCSVCGEWPCVCPCPLCGQHPCVCPCPACGQRPCICLRPPAPVLGLDATPVMDGGHVGADKVAEMYVGFATEIAKSNPAHHHSNPVQLGHAFQQFVQMQQQHVPQQATIETVEINPGAERKKLQTQINKWVKKLGFDVYHGDFAAAYHTEIEVPFRCTFTVILGTWSVDQLRRVADRLERRMKEAFRNG